MAEYDPLTGNDTVPCPRCNAAIKPYAKSESCIGEIVGIAYECTNPRCGYYKVHAIDGEQDST